MSVEERASPYPLLIITVSCLFILVFSILQIINLASSNYLIKETNKKFIAQSLQVQNIISQPNQNYETIIKTLTEKFPTDPLIANKFGITTDIAKLPSAEQIPTIVQRVKESMQFQTQNEKTPVPLIVQKETWWWTGLIWLAGTIFGRIVIQLTDRIYKQRIEPWLDKHCSFKK